MYRSHTCGELRIADKGKKVTLAGWVQKSRKLGGMNFIDLRDRYGITQLVFNEEVNAPLCERANKLGREFVIQVTGTNGKTTAKELIAAVLGRKYKVRYTQGNLNNHIGVPLTLLSITKDDEIAVVETGANHPGEIAFLCGMVKSLDRKSVV